MPMAELDSGKLSAAGLVLPLLVINSAGILVIFVLGFHCL